MKFYIAAPFFNEDQNRRVDDIIGECNAFGHKFFSPRDHCLYKPGMDPQVIIDDNKKHISECDCVIAVTNDRDPGTLIEVGWADEMGKLIIFLWENPPEGMKFNIVMAAIGNAVCTSISELSDVLEEIQETGEIPWVQYEGDME